MEGLEEFCQHGESIVLDEGILSQDCMVLQGNLVHYLGKEIVVLGFEARKCPVPITPLKKGVLLDGVNAEKKVRKMGGVTIPCREFDDRLCSQ